MIGTSAITERMVRGSFHEQSGKTKEEIDSGYVMAEEECDFLEDNDEYIFGMLKDPDFKKEDSVGTAYFYAENNTDHLIYLVLSEIYANNIRIKTKKMKAKSIMMKTRNILK